MSDLDAGDALDNGQRDVEDDVQQVVPYPGDDEDLEDDFDEGEVAGAQLNTPVTAEVPTGKVKTLSVAIAMSLTLVFFSDVKHNPMKLFTVKDWRAAVSSTALSASVVVYPLDSNVNLADKSVENQVLSQALIGSLTSAYKSVDSSVAGQIDMCLHTDLEGDALTVSVGTCYEMPVPKSPQALEAIAESARRRSTIVAHSNQSAHAFLIPYTELFGLSSSDLSLHDTLDCMRGIDEDISLLSVRRTGVHSALGVGIVTPVYVSEEYGEVTEEEINQCLALLDRMVSANEALSQKRDFAIALFFA